MPNVDKHPHAPVNYWEPRDNILELMASALRRDQTIPQDLLYRVHGGASLWEYLTRHDQSLLRHVYDQFRHLHGPVDKIAQQMQQRLAINKGTPKARLGVLALGCGDGWREQAICKGLLQHKLASCLDVAFVDLSPDLIAMATKNFGEVTFADGRMFPRYMDFEDTAKLRAFRADFANPMVVLLLGNTIGNVDARQMLVELNKALPRGDHLLLEVLMHKDGKEDIDTEIRSAEGDPRARLIVNPLRQFGIFEPDLSRLVIKKEVQANGGLVTRKYVYRFDANESKTIRHHIPDRGDFTIIAGSEIALLEVKSMSLAYLSHLLSSIFDSVEVLEHRYVVGAGQEVLMGYAFGASRDLHSRPGLTEWDNSGASLGVLADPHATGPCTTCQKILSRIPTRSAVEGGTSKVKVVDATAGLGNTKACMKYLKTNNLVDDEGKPRSGLLRPKPTSDA